MTSVNQNPTPDHPNTTWVAAAIEVAARREGEHVHAAYAHECDRLREVCERWAADEPNLSPAVWAVHAALAAVAAQRRDASLRDATERYNAALLACFAGATP